ncbi:hypothetical protein X798_07429 [Onchocerca flexuosa]|uniref:Uncharacterized protein n=2 Tax=Onchocerca flexuosa TaxID=387005 RepID=A0A183HP89_9BILA|nr:hypothetical protein X798_07429 [Onchocerca flexuosa]VDO59584.1 unnamed protein product [Onchocerca flexuosa]
MPSLVPMNVSGTPPIVTTTATTTDLLQTSQGKIAVTNNLMNNSMLISRSTPYASHQITPGSNMLARYSGIDQMHIDEHHQLIQNSGSVGGSGSGSDLLMTVGGQLSGLGGTGVPVTNTLNSYTTTDIAATNSSLLNISGNGKLGYSGTSGINYDGLLKSYQQTSGTLREVHFLNSD